MIDIYGRPFGTILLAAVFLVFGVAATLAFYGALPRTAGTSPLMAMFFGVCACSYLTAAVLTWRRSGFAGYAWLAAVVLLLFPARFLFPGQDVFVPALAAVMIGGVIGYRYLRLSNGAAS